MAKGLSVEEQTGIEFPEHLHWLWESFCKLSRRRVANETGPQPFTAADILAQAQLLGLTSADDIEDFEFFMDELDIVWLRKTHADIQREREKEKRRAESKRR